MKGAEKERPERWEGNRRVDIPEEKNSMRPTCP